jgi:gliding motility-associated-like protein
MDKNPTVLRKWALGLFILICFVLTAAPAARATHIRAGEITAKSDTALVNPNPLKYYFKLVTYVVGNANIPDQTATLFFGDGTSQTSQKIETILGNNITRRVFYFDHIYPASGRCFTAVYNEQNRNGSIKNITTPSMNSFYVSTTICLNPQIGINRSPQFAVPPLDIAAQGQIFIHFPGAFDLDQDSLSYKMRVPQQNVGPVAMPVAGPVFGYRLPNDPSFGGTTVNDPITGTGPGQPAKFTLNEVTGEIRWNTPNVLGEFNIAFVVEEWKIIPGRNPLKIGEITRDMQITVQATLNKAPLLRIPRDTCVVAGTFLQVNISATDRNTPPDPFTFNAYSGIIPPATFSQGSPNNATFTWNTQCTDVSDQPYQVIFKVTDNPISGDPHLTDLQDWYIRVVGPKPSGLTTTLLANRQMRLDWNNYQTGVCANAQKILIYRRQNKANFIPGPCETGVPSSTGYVKVGEVNANVNTFLDTNNGAGLEAGKNYCYVIYAKFPGPKNGESLASDEVCTEVPEVTSVITNVSVTETSKTTGKIQVRWTQPLAGISNFTGPFEYRLYRAFRSENQPFQQIFTTADVNALSFIDQNLNTLDSAYRYKVEFYFTANGSLQLLAASTQATSVRLDAASKGLTLDLTWTYNVPWDNTAQKHSIFREINGTFVKIDEIFAGPEGGKYTDLGIFNDEPLEFGKQYCYYVETVGAFTNPKLPPVVHNNSEIICAVVRDTVPPCPPILAIAELQCDSLQRTPFSPPFQNKLKWQTDPNPTCGKDIKEFKLYFRETDQGDFTNIATTTGLTFLHENLKTTAGCYAVTAVDSSGNESKFSNIVCQDVCYFFELPNIITPNGDGLNDTFRPRQSAFVRDVKFTVFNRWGQRVFEGSGDPAINWRGVNNSGNRVPDGIYYYLAEVEFAGLNPGAARRVFKGWVEIVE